MLKMLREFKMLKVLSLMVGVLLIITALPAFAAQFAHAELMVAPADVEKNKDKWVILDCRDKANTEDAKTKEVLKGYDSGHIPGAINLGGDCAKILRTKEESVVFKDANGKIDAAKYNKILGDAGISSDKTIVVYADAKRITNASVGFWILDLLGQKDVRFLNGGIEAWEAAGKKLDTKETKLPPAKYEVSLRMNIIATTDEVLKIAKGEVKGPQIVDSRTPEEYAGTDVRAKKGGHIPKTVLNVSHTGTYDKKTGIIKSADELEKLYSKLDKTKRTIPYCQTGTRSTLTYLQFKAMGFKDVANYDDSWIVWGNKENTPIEK
ncbi:MAG: sulfurtransferase [Nitrospirae bacterium]|nr:sulfurtransferase [Nitrospirota bacterium]